MQPQVFINHISTAVPETEVHEMFLREGPKFLKEERDKKIFKRIASRGQIERRYSVLPMAATETESGLLEFYQMGAFPTTAARMLRYQKHALPLALKSIAPLKDKTNLQEITHLIVTSCTGFYAPGLDIELVRELGLKPSVERTIVGFMGCYAAFNGLKLAHSIVLARPDAKVLMVNIELCTLHLQEISDIESMLGFLIFADGCAASIVSRASGGLEITGFRNELGFSEIDKITWQVGDQGFDMFLSTEVPAAIGRLMPERLADIVASSGDVPLWAIHPGGRAILDVIQEKLVLSDEQMQASREVLRDCGNMSSASVMFVLQKHLYQTATSGEGWAMAFGPGLTVEAMKFLKTPL